MIPLSGVLALMLVSGCLGAMLMALYVLEDDE